MQSSAVEYNLLHYVYYARFGKIYFTNCCTVQYSEAIIINFNAVISCFCRQKININILNILNIDIKLHANGTRCTVYCLHIQSALRSKKIIHRCLQNLPQS